MYAGYGEGRLTSLVIINAKQANSTQTNKSSLNISLALDADTYKGQTLYLSYLTAPGADSTNATVWNGMQYSDDDGTATLSASDAVREVTIGDDGTAVVSVRDSQAVIAYIGARLGTNKVLLNSTIPDDTNDDGGAGNSTSSGTSTSDSDKSAAVVSVDVPCVVVLLILAFWTCVGSHIW